MFCILSVLIDIFCLNVHDNNVVNYTGRKQQFDILITIINIIMKIHFCNQLVGTINDITINI